MNWTTYDQYVVTGRRTFPGYPYPRQIDRICLKWISSVASIRNYYSLTNFHFVGLCWCTAICKSQTRWMIVIFRFLYKHCLYHFFFLCIHASRDRDQSSPAARIKTRWALVVVITPTSKQCPKPVVIVKSQVTRVFLFFMIWTILDQLPFTHIVSYWTF